ncbi:hypothetical protein CBF34_11075 [Vagococcus penaei]|uniref:Uncharacterized protein n=1 Tax=Vagococcus penaei TaxID=633807 RepID=A0A1Q2D7S6_9ENTE|nr:glycine cleavage system protein H [Vagococcus penaei]AQP54476.1 hypothetical protein BW732_09845 [Vagococcus penaei]RST97394.1 hypothetical protein CBF34_11075 [Vagococcus penaei]
MTDKNLWIKEEGDLIRVGLSEQAQDDLGKISFASFPKVGTIVELGDEVVELEAEKAVVEYESPVSGTVVEVNEAAQNQPSLLDEAKAWLFVVKP